MAGQVRSAFAKGTEAIFNAFADFVDTATIVTAPTVSAAAGPVSIDPKTNLPTVGEGVAGNMVTSEARALIEEGRFRYGNSSRPSICNVKFTIPAVDLIYEDSKGVITAIDLGSIQSLSFRGRSYKVLDQRLDDFSLDLYCQVL